LGRSGKSEGLQWAAFFSQHSARLAAYGLALTGNADDAEDVVQTVLLRCVTTVRQPRDALAYVLRCMRHQRIDDLRSASRRPIEASLDIAIDAVFEANGTAAPEDSGRVSKCLAQLTTEQREVIILKIYCGMSQRDIATILRQAPGTVASHYSRGLAALRELMAEEVGHV
jgi:RNA polymerase sigma factor (sigma-70 family)